MLVAIIGENCVGKSTLAKQLNEKLNAQCYSGKDYLRLYRQRGLEPKQVFRRLHSPIHQKIP